MADASTVKHAAELGVKAAGDWVVPLARAGYVAKGVVYAVVGVIAVQAALGSGTSEGSRGAVATIAQQPFGQVILGVLALGLLGYVIWKVAQSVFDAESQGSDAKGLVNRTFYGLSALSHASLGVLAATIALQGRQGGASGGGRQEITAQLLSAPGGQVIVGAIGAVVIGFGLYQLYRATTSDFMETYRRAAMSPTEERVARRAGQGGLAARGVVFGITGGFLIQAAVRHDPSQAKGLDAALSTLAAQPFGAILLGGVAIGLLAYAFHCLIKSRYRRFEVA